MACLLEKCKLRADRSVTPGAIVRRLTTSPPSETRCTAHYCGETRHMFSIVGILIVFGAVLGGFLMEKGPLAVLMQPSELVIIGGAAIGTMLAANPMYVLKKIFAGLVQIVSGSKFSTQRYLDTLKMMFLLFNKARKEGLVAIEGDIEDPAKSPLFSKYAFFLANHHI